MLEFDDAAAQQLLRMYRGRDASDRRRRALDVLALRPGERVLELGPGPGLVCLEAADRVGPAGTVTAVDSSSAMLGIAQALCAGRPEIALLQGEALDLPLKAASADAAIAVQVLEYVPDTVGALRELHRVLRPGGRLLVWDTDWDTLSWHSEDEPRMREVVAAWAEHLAHPSLPKQLPVALRAAGFSVDSVLPHPFLNVRADDDALSAGLLPLITDFVTGRREITRAQAEAWRDEQRTRSESGDYYFSVTQVLVLARR